MKQKIALLFLFITTGVSILCTSGIIFYQHILHEIAESKNYDEKSLTCIEISETQYRSLNLENLNNSVKEVNLQGELMDVYKIKTEGNKVKLFVKIDKDETEAISLLLDQDHQTTNSKKMLGSFLGIGLFFEKIKPVSFNPPAFHFSPSFCFHQTIPTGFFAVSTQPPDLV